MPERSPLQIAADTKNVKALWDAVGSLEQDLSTVSLLTRLLLEDWHDVHEDIVFELGLIGDPRAVGAIAEAIAIPFQHMLQWNNLHEFQRKCAYALARIGTLESRTVLESLAENSDRYLREYGEEGLSHWPMPYVRPS